MDRVTLFVDAQNCYFGARENFGGGFHTNGQFDPIALGELICSRPPPGCERTLHEVRIYTGRPESTKQPKTYGAHMRQCAHWERGGAIVIARTLRYPRDWPVFRAEEKGVDVALAIDFVTGAVDGTYDVGVIFSTDTDLRPALEWVMRRYDPYPRPEAAAWRGQRARQRLQVRVKDRRSWCHMLDREVYDAVADETDYNVA